MKRDNILTIWENEASDIVDDKASEFINTHFSNYESKQIGSLGSRNARTIFESLEESKVILMLPHAMSEIQIMNIVKMISHAIHVNLNGAQRKYEIQKFVFYSSNPYIDLKLVRSACAGVKDGRDDADALNKILKNCEIHFYGYDGEHYEMRSTGYHTSDILAVRYN